MAKPIVGIPSDRRMVGDHPFNRVGEKYIVAVRDGAGALPLLIPAIDPPLPIGDLIASVDGFLFTGSTSNVAPHRYGGPNPRFPELLDETRDATTLPLMLAGIEAGDLITTGTVTRAFPVKSGQRWHSVISGLPLQGLSTAFI